jgi:2-polyprenyl-3-methyl-5-hydroxy-6-metoxy-1,4-benzoquinol methylase
MIKTKSASYAQFAEYYDRLGWSEFSELIFPVVLKFFRKLGKTPSTYLDIACGTGVLARMLSEKHITTTGIDISPEMISAAREKKLIGVCQPDFLIADMTDFNLNAEFEVVSCFFDSINHLLSRSQIKKAFTCARRHLLDGGWYLFDMVTRLGLENWKDFYETKSDSHYVAQEAHFLPQKDHARVKIEAFIKDENGATIHIKEVFNEIFLPLELTYKYLAEAGFSKIIVKPFPPAKSIEESERIMFYAQK